MIKFIQTFIVATVLFSSVVNAANVLFDAAIRSVDKKFTYYDKELNAKKYGNAQWESRVNAKRLSIEKALKKIEKKWPNEDISAKKASLQQRVSAFQQQKASASNNKVSAETTAVTNKVKPKQKSVKTTKKVDRLLQLTLKSIDDKFKEYDKLLAQKKYGRNQWFQQLDNKKKIIVSAITKLKDKYPEKYSQPLLKQLETREKNLRKNTFEFINNIVKQRFVAFDKHMKQKAYGNKKWDEKLKGLGGNLNNAIKYLAKKWPAEAKGYRKNFRKRVAIIKLNNKKVADIAKAKVAKENKAQDIKPKVVLAATQNNTLNKKASGALLDKVKKDQANYKNNGSLEVWDNSTGTLKKSDGPASYLSFSSQYDADAKEERSQFNGQDFIYAQIHLPKNLTSLLPKENAKGLQYYKVTIKASVKGNSLYSSDKTQKNANRLQRKADFVLGYNTDDLVIAVVPEKAFFESVLDKYRTDGKFEDVKTEEKALRDLLSRNFSRQMSNLFKKLTIGDHQVDMEFQVLAKLQSSKYYELKNIKGTFLLTVDKASKEKHINTFDMLSSLYRTYESQHNIAVSGLNIDAEKKRIANMSPRERERYNIAKISATGYMAAYGGERAKVTFRFGKLRTKNAYIDIVWNKGACAKCEEGSTSVVVRKTAAKTFNIPVGARVTLNGRTLINRVSSKQTMPLYWHY